MGNIRIDFMNLKRTAMNHRLIHMATSRVLTIGIICLLASCGTSSENSSPAKGDDVNGVKYVFTKYEFEGSSLLSNGLGGNSPLILSRSNSGNYSLLVTYSDAERAVQEKNSELFVEDFKPLNFDCGKLQSDNKLICKVSLTLTPKVSPELKQTSTYTMDGVLGDTTYAGTMQILLSIAGQPAPLNGTFELTKQDSSTQGLEGTISRMAIADKSRAQLVTQTASSKNNKDRACDKGNNGVGPVGPKGPVGAPGGGSGQGGQGQNNGGGPVGPVGPIGTPGGGSGQGGNGQNNGGGPLGPKGPIGAPGGDSGQGGNGQNNGGGSLGPKGPIGAPGGDSGQGGNNGNGPKHCSK